MQQLALIAAAMLAGQGQLNAPVETVETQNQEMTQVLPGPKVSKRLAKILAKSDGRTQATAYKVSSVADEYAIMRVLGLQSEQQALIIPKGKAYDRLTATDPNTGAKREVWFDISSFFGRGFGF
ncbi:DUF4919 domain-containing protein [Novosphingobium sp. B 225]|uniref:DUF4919 domain-containing protein n=1 Tax=Novosphingobium sp. B 225 TaxID=1961849 RepID=UPI000B4ADD6C|nr:hypothetical protein [Novosphingobium sp. B 225]